MKKCQNKQKIGVRTKGLLLVVLGLLLALSPIATGTIGVDAKTKEELESDRNELNGKIVEAERKIAEAQAKANEFALQARTLASEIAKLKAEAEELQAMIELNQAKYDELVEQIVATEKKIQDNKDALGLVIADKYFAEKITPIERLASSKNLSSYVDKEVAMSVVSDNLKMTVDEIKALKESLEQQKLEQTQIIENQKAQKSALESKKQEQQRIWNETKGQEAEFQRIKGETAKEKERLEDEQQAILREIDRLSNASAAVPGDPNKGSYPWSGSCPSPLYNAGAYDNWGMEKCQCVSYAAWRVDRKWGNMPYWGGKYTGGYQGGNAKNWKHNSILAGIPGGTTPKPNSVGVQLSGTYGHVVWVEAVSGNRVYISQYNVANAATNWKKGDYSEQWKDATAYDYYIYFGEWK